MPVSVQLPNRASWVFIQTNPRWAHHSFTSPQKLQREKKVCAFSVYKSSLCVFSEWSVLLSSSETRQVILSSLEHLFYGWKRDGYLKRRVDSKYCFGDSSHSLCLNALETPLLMLCNQFSAFALLKYAQSFLLASLGHTVPPNIPSKRTPFCPGNLHEI